MNDRDIVSLFFDRSEAAITELKLKYGRLLSSIARNILKDERDAEECVNDACLAVWERIPPERPESLMAYTARIVRNISTKTYHRNTAQKRNSFYDAALDELSNSLPSPSTPEGELLSSELAGLINRFLSEQKRENRILFVRRYWYSDSIPEISKRLGMSENSVYVRLSRIREKLGKYLEKEGYHV